MFVFDCLPQVELRHTDNARHYYYKNIMLKLLIR